MPCDLKLCQQCNSGNTVYHRALGLLVFSADEQISIFADDMYAPFMCIMYGHAVVDPWVSHVELTGLLFKVVQKCIV